MDCLNTAGSVGTQPPLQPWFALRVRSNFERIASIHLRDRGFEEFTPSYETKNQWSDRKKVIVRFLFPGYVFCRMNPDYRQLAMTVPGVMNILGFGAGGPQAIPEEEIQRVRKMVESGLPTVPWPYIEAGQLVLIEHGPLAGIEGILERFKGTERLVISVSLLRRSVSAEIERSWIRPLQSTGPKILPGQDPPTKSPLASRRG